MTLEAKAQMQGDDAAREIEMLATLESGAFHHRLKRCLIRVAPNRFGQIAVARGVFRDQRTHARQNLERVRVVRGIQRPELRPRELEHEQPPTWFQHAVHRTEGHILVGHVAQTEADRHTMKASVPERQQLGIGDDTADVAGDSGIEQAVAPDVEHLAIDVGNDDPASGSDPSCQRDAEIGCTGGDVERRLPGFEPRLFDREAFPEPVQAERHQIVHQVVARCHRVEDAAHTVPFLRDRDSLVAEVGVAAALLGDLNISHGRSIGQKRSTELDAKWPPLRSLSAAASLATGLAAAAGCDTRGQHAPQEHDLSRLRMNVTRSGRGSRISASLLSFVILGPANALAQLSDDFLIVDCLLPPQVRQLGQRSTFLSARRPIKTSASDCGIRGGEYVAYDRADYATALRIWLPLAEDGDPEASANVGEIYEKGLGLDPDYAVAADWYLMAAEAGNVRAQINLGHLYEKGLGVERDPLRALEWYRRAAGLEEEIQLLPTELSSGAVVELDTLRHEVEALRGESESLRRALDSAREEIGTLEQELETSAEPSEASPDLSEELSLNDTLEALNREIDARAEEAAGLAEQIRAMRRELSETSNQLDESRRELARQRTLYQQAAAELGDAEEERQTRQRELDELSASIAERQSLLDESQAAIDSREELLEQLELQLDSLEASAADRRQEIAALQTQQSSLLERVLAGPEITLIDPQVLASRAIVAVAAAGSDATRLSGRLLRRPGYCRSL